MLQGLPVPRSRRTEAEDVFWRKEKSLGFITQWVQAIQIEEENKALFNKHFD